MLLRGYKYFQCFHIYTSTYRQKSVYTDKNFIFTDLTVIQALTDNNKFMIKKIFDICDIDKKWTRVSFDLFKVNKIYQVYTCLKSVRSVI